MDPGGSAEKSPDDDKAQEPLTSTGGAAAIAARLRQAILDGTFVDNERLPAERDLAARFGASRSTIRDALQQLESMKLVTRRIGSGTYVNYAPTASQDEIAEVTSPLELIEVRMAIEPHIARLGVVHATKRDLERLSDALAELERCGGDRERFSSADEKFHQAMAECTGNPLMAWLYKGINEVRNHSQWAVMKKAVLNPKEIRAYNRQHRALYEALVARDREAAVRAITQHLEKARDALLGA